MRALAPASHSRAPDCACELGPFRSVQFTYIRDLVGADAEPLPIAAVGCSCCISCASPAMMQDCVCLQRTPLGLFVRGAGPGGSAVPGMVVGSDALSLRSAVCAHGTWEVEKSSVGMGVIQASQGRGEAWYTQSTGRTTPTTPRGSRAPPVGGASTGARRSQRCRVAACATWTRCMACPRACSMAMSCCQTRRPATRAVGTHNKHKHNATSKICAGTCAKPSSSHQADV